MAQATFDGKIAEAFKLLGIAPEFIALLTWTCASGHNCLHFFDMSTSSPRMVCFVGFDFQMCFAPQRRALFRHHNFQKCSEPGVFCTFWLGNVLRATTGRALFQHHNFQKCSEPGVFCTFWLGNVLRATTACTFSTSQLPKVLQTWGVLSFSLANVLRATTAISHLARWLRTRRFSEPTFRPSGANLLSSALLLSDCDSSHLCFSICPYRRKFDF